MSSREPRTPCIRTIAPAPFFPGKNQPRNVAPDVLGNWTLRPFRSVGKFPTGRLAGALNKLPASQTIRAAITIPTRLPTTSVLRFGILKRRSRDLLLHAHRREARIE